MVKRRILGSNERDDIKSELQEVVFDYQKLAHIVEIPSNVWHVVGGFR